MACSIIAEKLDRSCSYRSSADYASNSNMKLNYKNKDKKKILKTHGLFDNCWKAWPLFQLTLINWLYFEWDH